MTFWIDTHCHLDAPEFGAQALLVRQRAAIKNVARCVLPSVEVANFDTVRQLAHASADSYALGIHPLYVQSAREEDLGVLDAQLGRYRDDPHLVAVGEMGLDFFVPELCTASMRERQEYFYLEQLKLAQKHQLPVILHVRRSADRLLKGLRCVGRSGHGPAVWQGIAHAFNGSEQQARAFIELGLKLGFGGAVTYSRALQLRRLAASLPLQSIVLETDAPDMPPHWLYTTAAGRAAGLKQMPNEPAELPRIGGEIAALRGISVQALAQATTANALQALPGLRISHLAIIP